MTTDPDKLFCRAIFERRFIGLPADVPPMPDQLDAWKTRMTGLLGSHGAEVLKCQSFSEGGQSLLGLDFSISAMAYVRGEKTFSALFAAQTVSRQRVPFVFPFKKVVVGVPQRPI